MNLIPILVGAFGRKWRRRKNVNLALNNIFPAPFRRRSPPEAEVYERGEGGGARRCEGAKEGRNKTLRATRQRKGTERAREGRGRARVTALEEETMGSQEK